MQFISDLMAEDFACTCNPDEDLCCVKTDHYSRDMLFFVPTVKESTSAGSHERDGSYDMIGVLGYDSACKAILGRGQPGLMR